jgi:hypothetical protein
MYRLWRIWVQDSGIRIPQVRQEGVGPSIFRSEGERRHESFTAYVVLGGRTATRTIHRLRGSRWANGDTNHSPPTWLRPPRRSRARISCRRPWGAPTRSDIRSSASWRRVIFTCRTLMRGFVCPCLRLFAAGMRFERYCDQWTLRGGDDDGCEARSGVGFCSRRQAALGIALPSDRTYILRSHRVGEVWENL